MNGAIYWTLREFAVSPGWTGGATLPAGTVPDGLHHKGLIAYDGTDKPAFAVVKQLFATHRASSADADLPVDANRTSTRLAFPDASPSWTRPAALRA